MKEICLSVALSAPIQALFTPQDRFGKEEYGTVVLVITQLYDLNLLWPMAILYAAKFVKEFSGSLRSKNR